MAGYDIDQYLEDIQEYHEFKVEIVRGPLCPRCGGDSEDPGGEYWECVECLHKFDEVEEEDEDAVSEGE